MSLKLGDRLGPYEVVAPLGAGGMGEVYRARDTRLGRDAALKILPDAFVHDPDRLARFQREAQVLASLNHPHIGGIYGLEERDGVRALALEFIDGLTLADRISSGALPLDEALSIARQIVDALDAAHTQGIVHRDLKPPNIKLRPDGVAKVLDFGLAKTFNGEDLDATRSPTITAVSRSGVILGTAAYMSPEQARGRPVDKRADIWAFGCVLFEMLSGTSPFASETITDTLSAIVSREPDWKCLPASTPTELRRLLEHTLEKDPKHRLRDIADARVQLLPSASAAVVAATPPQFRSNRAWQATAAVATIAAVILGASLWRRSTPTRASERLPQLTRITSDAGLTAEPSLNADGRILAYASDRSGTGDLDIWVQQTAGGGAVRLTDDPADDRSPDVSPDGTLVAFRSDRGDGGIYVAPALGGDARLIAPEGRVPRFSPDGRSIAFWTGTWLAVRGAQSVRRTYIVDVTSGVLRQIAADLASSGDPVWSPDGRSMLVHGRRALSGPESQANWWLVPIDGGASRATDAYESFAASGIEIVDVDQQPYPREWTSAGVLFSASARDRDVRSIWRLDLDEQSGRVTGAPRKVTLGTMYDEHPAAADDGALVFAALARHSLILGLPLDANAGRALGDVRVLHGDVAQVVRATISEDGNTIAFQRYEAKSASVWIRDLGTGRERQVAVTRRTPLNPVVSPDGRWVAFTASHTDTGGQSGIGVGFVLPVQGGSPRKICDDCELYQWLRSDAHVVVRRPDGALGVIDVATGKVIVLVIPDTAASDALRPIGGPLGRPLVSYDERFISFIAQGRAYVAPFSISGPSRAVRGARFSRWRAAASAPAAGRRTAACCNFLLERDGFRCLYAVRIDPRTGDRTGDPFPVAHFHNGSRVWGSTGFSSAVANGLFVFNQYGLAGNVWQSR